MRIIKPLKLGLLFRTFETGGKDYFSCSILCFCPFSGQNLLEPETSMWEVLAKELGKDAAVDVSMPKPRGEVLIAGRFYAPGGRPVQAGQVTARIGQREKRLLVFGDRFWKRTVTGGWKIFRHTAISDLDLTWENAFGGQSFPQNPVGKGIDSVTLPDGSGMVPLPCIEYPDQLVTSPGDRPDPAGFAPLDITWPQRTSKAGTYDDKWLKELFPGFPDDMDWSIFNMAPEDQHIEGYLDGSEAFLFENMHPDKPEISGRLPGLRPRCFIVQDRDDTKDFMEIGLRLDTAWFIPHIERALLIYRGVHEVSDEDAQDIETILLACESAREDEKSGDFYRHVLEKRIDKETGYLNSLDESDLLPAGEPSAIAELTEKADEPDIIMENMARRVEREKEKADAMCREFGVDPATLKQETEPQPEINMQNLSELPGIIRKLEKEAMEKKEAMEEMAGKMAQEAGFDLEELMLNAKKNQRRWPKFSAREAIENLRSFGLDDPDKEAKLLEMEEFVSRSMRPFAHHLDPAFPREREEIQEITRRITDARASGQSLKDVDLAFADLSHMDLSGMDFSYAYLEGADFSYANLEGARFKGTILVRSRFRRSNLKSADLAEANLGHSDLKDTNFSGACLKDAVLSGAKINASVFSSADLENIDLSNAEITDCDFTNTIIRQALLLEAKLKNTNFSRADMTGASFLYSNLERCDFSSALLKSATLVKVPAGCSSFSSADLTSACLADECDFSNCDFSGAKAAETNFRGSNLSDTCFREADVSGADFGQCLLSEADFTLSVAIGTSFAKADLTGARLKGANLMDAVMQQAVLHETDMTASNLYGANFIKARFRNCNITLANTKRAFMEPWVKA